MYRLDPIYNQLKAAYMVFIDNLFNVFGDITTFKVKDHPNQWLWTVNSNSCWDIWDQTKAWDGLVDQLTASVATNACQLKVLLN